MRELELYFHIPFCVKKCSYCDFLSAPADEKSQSAYVDALQREIAFYGKRMTGRRVSSIYIGGGTPSWLQEAYIARLMEEASRFFAILPDAEITIECNPGTLTKGKLSCYKALGINRLSLGLQSSHDDELKLLGRIHTYEQFLRNFELAREYGFDNINVDLMDSLPHQTLEKFYQTLAKTVALRPEHISCYSLIIEKGTPFYDRYKFDQVMQQAGMPTKELPTENVVYQMGKLAQDVLAGSGYGRYEVSNFAKSGYECRHNIGYWTRQEYLGAGLGASSLLCETRYGNVRDLEAYMRRSSYIEETELPDSQREDRVVRGSNLHESAFAVSRDARMEEFMFLGLRMTAGIEKSRFYQTFGLPVDFVYGEVIQKLKSDGLLAETSQSLYLTDTGMDLNNFAVSQFLL